MPAPLTGTVVGRFVSAERRSGAQSLTGTVMFTPSPLSVLVPGDSSVVLPAVTVAPLDRSGQLWHGGLGVVLTATNDPGTNPTGFTYRVSFNLRDQAGKIVPYAPFDITVPAGQTVDLATVAPVSASLGVLSVLNGGTAGGPVTAIRVRRDTAAGWAVGDPVLASGELGYVKDSGDTKTGDGVSRWSELGFSSLGEASLNATYVPAMAATSDIVYDATTGNVTSITEGGITTTFTYNADGTVNTETRQGKVRTWTYDANGNPTSSTVV